MTDVSDVDIRALQSKATIAGDDLQVALCLVALDHSLTLGEPDDRVESQRRALERLGVIPEHVGSDVRARELCSEAILHGR